MITTEKIIFLAQQSPETRQVLANQDDVTTQSLDNLASLAALFNSKGTGVIHDELGYISFDKEGAESLFTHLSLRAGRAATIITSN